MMKSHDDDPQDTSLIYDAVVFESLNIYNNSNKLNHKPVNILLQEDIQSRFSKLSLKGKSPLVGFPTIEEDSAENNESDSLISDYTNTVVEETLPSQDVANVSSKRNELEKKETSLGMTNGEYFRDLIKCSGLTQNVTNNQEHAATSIKLSSSVKRSKSPSKNNVPETKTARYCLCKGSKSELEKIKFKDLINMVALGEKLFCSSKNLVKTCSKEDISNEKNLDPCSSNDISKNHESRKKAPTTLPKPLRPTDISKISGYQKNLPQKMNKPYVVCYTYETDTEHLSSDDKKTPQFLKGSTNKFNNSKESFDLSTVSATAIMVQTQRLLSYDVSDQDERLQNCCDSESCILRHPSEYWQQSKNTSNRFFKDPSINRQLTNQDSSRTQKFKKRLMSLSLSDNDSVSVPRNTSASNIIIFSEDYPSKTEQREKSKTSSHYSIDDQPLRQGGDKSMSKITKYFNKFLKSPLAHSNKINKRFFDCAQGKFVDYPKYDCSAIDKLQQKVEGLETTVKDLLENRNEPQEESSLEIYDNYSNNIPPKRMEQNDSNSGSYNKNLADDKTFCKNYISCFPTFKRSNDKTTKTTSQTVMTSKTMFPSNVQYNKGTTMYTDQNIQTLQTNLTSNFQPNQNEIINMCRKHQNPCGCCGPTIILPPNYFGKIPEEPNPKPIKKESTCYSKLVNTISLKLHRHRTELKDLKALTKKCMNILQDDCKGRITNNPFGDQKTENYDKCNRMCCEYCACGNREKFVNPVNCECDLEINGKSNSESYGRDSRRTFESDNVYNRRNSEKHDRDYRKNSDDHEKNNKRLSQNSDRDYRDYRGSIENHDMYERNSEKKNEDHRENPDHRSINFKKLSENSERSSIGSNMVSLETYVLYNTEKSEKNIGDYRENLDNHSKNYKKLSENPERSSRGSYTGSFETDYMYTRRNSKKHDGGYRKKSDDREMNNKRLSQNLDRDYRGSIENRGMYNKRNSDNNNGDHRENSDNRSMNFKKLSKNPERSSRESRRESFENYDMYNKKKSEKNSGDYKENPDNHDMNYKIFPENSERRFRGSYTGSFETYVMCNTGKAEKNIGDYRENPDNHSKNYKKLSENPERSSRGSYTGSFETDDMYNRRNSKNHDGGYKKKSDDREMNNKRLSQNPDRDYRGSIENRGMYNKRNSENNSGDYRENSDNYSMNDKKVSENPENRSRGSPREIIRSYYMYNMANSEKHDGDYRKKSYDHETNNKSLSQNPNREYRGSFENRGMYNKRNSEQNNGDYKENPDNHSMNYKIYSENPENRSRESHRGSLTNFDMFNKENTETNNEDNTENSNNHSMNYKKLPENPENRSRGSHRGILTNFDMYNKENTEKNNEDNIENSDKHPMNYKKPSENPERSSRESPRESFKNYVRYNSENNYGDYRENRDNYKMNNKRLFENPCRDCKASFKNPDVYNKESSETHYGDYRRNFGNYDMYNGRNSEKHNENCRENPDVDYRESFESHKCNRRNHEINTRTFVNPDRDYNRSFENCKTYCRQKFDELEINFKRYPEIDDRNSRGNFESDNLYNRRNFEIRYGNCREYPDNYKMNNQRLSENPDKECRGNFENHELYNKENSKNNVVNHETANKTNLQKCIQCNITNSENNDKIGNLGKSNTNLSKDIEDDKNVQVDENIDLQNAVNDQGASEIIDSSTPPPKQSKSRKRWFFRRKKAAKTPEDSKKAVETVPKPKSSKGDVKSLSSREYNTKTIQQKKEMTVLWIT